MTAKRDMLVNGMEMVEVNKLTETVNSNGSLAVVLNDLVGSRLRTPALDERIAIALERERVFADIDPPDVLDGARALAVDTLDLVLADDGVLESGTVLELEDGVRVAALDLTGARGATAVGLHAAIEDAGDDLNGLVGDGALGGRDGEAGALVEAEKPGGSVGSRASGDGCDKRGDGESSDGELHDDG
jgi:hypothetical protein